jgi:hypothetical protein
MEIGQRYKSIRTNTIAVSADLSHLADMGGIVGARHLPVSLCVCPNGKKLTRLISFILSVAHGEMQNQETVPYTISYTISERGDLQVRRCGGGGGG